MSVPYILTWNYPIPDSIRLIGPFESEDAAAGWARWRDGGLNPNNPNDDAQWQVVLLPDRFVQVVVNVYDPKTAAPLPG